MSDRPKGLTPLPSTVDALLQLGDEEFVRAAYRLLLGREADPAGVTAYTDQVRAGESKEHLLLALVLSDEGRQRVQTLAGLEPLKARHGTSDGSRLRRLWRHLTGQEQRQAAEAQMRAIRVVENKVARLDSRVHEVARRLDENHGALLRVLAELQEHGWRPEASGHELSEADKARLHAPAPVRAVLDQFAQLRTGAPGEGASS